jgi:O-antigen/teichoic acid export membrane protein
VADKFSDSGARRMIGHASIYATGNILRQLVGFIMLPVYTRHLTPADYGVVGLMIFSISLIELFFGARLGQAVPKYFFDSRYEGHQSKVVSTAMIITASASLVTTIALIMLRQSVSQGIFGSPEFDTIVGLFSVLIVNQAVENYALTYLRIQQRPWLYVAVSLAKLVVQVSLNIYFVVILKMGVLGIATSAMISSSFFALLLLSYTMHHVGWGFDRTLAWKMISFCWPLWLASFAALYIGSANRYYLRIFSSLEDVGLFELAVKFGLIISLLVWEPFAQYWQVERFRYYRRGDAEHVFQDVFLFISTFLVLAALGVAIFAGPVIRIMADPAFHPASSAVPFLAFGFVFGSLINFSNFSFLIKEKTGWISRNMYLTAVIITVFYLGLIPLAGHVGAAIAYMLAHGIQFLIVHQAARRFYDMGIKLNLLGLILVVGGIACWLSNDLLARDSLLEDLSLKFLVFSSACVLILLPLWRKPSARRLIINLMPVSMAKYFSH